MKFAVLVLAFALCAYAAILPQKDLAPTPPVLAQQFVTNFTVLGKAFVVCSFLQIVVAVFVC